MPYIDRTEFDNLLINIQLLKKELKDINKELEIVNKSKSANVYRVEIIGQDDVSFIEAVSIDVAISIALYEHTEANQVKVFAQIVAFNMTLAEYQTQNPKLFDVQ
jgi:hypothetical protein